VSSKSKTTTTNTPYDPAAIKAGEGALSGAYGQAQGTIAQNSPALQTAINQIQHNIAAPPQYATDARAQLDKTITGGYLDPASNPYASGMAKLIGDRTQGNYNATFGASGRSHGGLAALLSGQGVADALGGFYGNIYNTERGNQQAATMAAPAFNQDEYTGINTLFPAVSGATMLPLNAANSYAGGTGQLISPYTTSTTTQRQSMLPQLIGAAAMIGGAAMGVPPGLTGGLSGLIGGGSSSGGLAPIMQGGGTANYFARSPFGGSAFGYMPGFGG
jgi:hypothetical protein